jgi:hypothetical protein
LCRFRKLEAEQAAAAKGLCTIEAETAVDE